MKNLFEYLLADDGKMNEEVFASFSNWMFEGEDEANELARHFLRWSVLFIIMNRDDGKPENSDFYAFFQGFERSDFDAFLSHVALYAEIAVLIEQTLGSDQANRFSGDNQSTYWYFFGKVMNHVENKNLFPDLPDKELRTPSTPRAKGPAEEEQREIQGLSDEDMGNLSRIFSIIFAVLLAGFVFFNLFL
jgi:hypothetical protein